jgi:hypothetical protein
MLPGPNFIQRISNRPNRAERRAAERRAAKLANKANQNTFTATAAGAAAEPFSTVTSSEPEPASEPQRTPISEARLNANRANAQHSTGPRTPLGKQTSCLNGVRTGLTGRTVLLPTDDTAFYQQHIDRHFAEYSPATDKERDLVQLIADTNWRLLRIAPLEAGIYAIGRRKLADQFADEPNLVNRAALIHTETFLVYRKELTNLALQERRLRNQRKSDIAELLALQQQRAEKSKDTAKKSPPAAQASLRGFAFTAEEFAYYNERNNEQFAVTGAHLDLATTVQSYRIAQMEEQAA